MSTIKDVTQWWKKHVSDRIQLILSMDRVDDWHIEKGTVDPIANVVIWRCPQGLYEVFALVPMAGSGEYLDDGTTGQYILDVTDTAPSFPHNPSWFPADTALSLTHAADAPTLYICRKPQGWTMSTGEILRNNNVSDPFTVRYRKLR